MGPYFIVIIIIIIHSRLSYRKKRFKCKIAEKKYKIKLTTLRDTATRIY